MKKKKKLSGRYVLLMLLCAGTVLCFTGCGSRFDSAGANTLVIEADGIQDISVEDYGDLDISAEELETYITEQIQKYSGSGTVTMERLKVKNNVARLTMHYDSIDTYNAFNAMEYTLVPAQEWEYKDGQLTQFTDEDGTALSSDEVKELLADEAARVLVAASKTDVVVTGKLLAFQGADASEDGTLHADQGTVIIFK